MMVPGSIEFPKELTNDLEVQEDGQTVIYQACAHDLYMDGTDNIRGGASLTKIICTTEASQKRGWFSRATTSVQTVKHTKLWTVNTGSSYDFFIFRGEVRNFGCSAWYGDDLRGAATSQNIILPKALIQEAFRPIEKKLLEIQRMVDAA